MNKIKYVLCLLAFYTCFNYSFGQAKPTLKAGFYNRFKGTLNGEKIRMLLRPSKNSTIITGKLCNMKNKKIGIRGSYDKQKITLTAIDSGKVIGYFKGILHEKYEGKNYISTFYKGTWQNATKTVTSEFDLLTTGYHYGSGALKHYLLEFGTDNEVDDFVFKLRKSILEDDIEWISDNINYPIRVSISKEKIVKIPNKKEFIKNYYKVIPKSSKKLIASYVPCLCGGYGGFGQRGSFVNGKISFELKNGSTKDNYGFAIHGIYLY